MWAVTHQHLEMPKQSNILYPQRSIQRKREKKGKRGKEEIRVGEKGTERARKERTRNKEEI